MSRKDVPGYEGLYQIDEAGGVYRVAWCRNPTIDGRIAEYVNPQTGYVYVSLSKNGKATSKRLHVLVAAAFLGAKPFDGAHVNHKDGCKQNNAASNLEYCSASENQRHAIATGLQPVRRGEDVASSKVTAEIVKAIVAFEGILTHKKIGERFGLTRKGVAGILSGRNWSHVTGRNVALRNRQTGAPRRKAVANA